MTKALIAATLGALALAASAAAAPGFTPLYPETIPGAGLSGVAAASHTIVRQATGLGVAGGVAFRLAPSRVQYGTFRSTIVRSTLFGPNAIKLHGTGLVHGRTVSFTAVGVHNAIAGVDVFRIAWNHGAALGGAVTSGSVFIR